ncbi:MAG TPA: Type 1 glutamine amidotransferase-like domain-containing protein [Actinomycetota bacterium]|nr:Type 1 glutamine amidotransferase-like domain-containing protein [Actinomycetota bacterium]
MADQGSGNPAQPGPIALVGGAEWTPPARGLDAWLLERSGGGQVTVVPTAAKDHPDMAVATARRHFAALGGAVQAAMVVTRSDAEDPAAAGLFTAARFIYLSGGDPGYLAETLRGTAAWEAIVGAWRGGALLAGSSAGAMVLCARMLRPGSTATEAGLGLFAGLMVLPHFEHWPPRLGKVGRVLAGQEVRVLGIDECTGLVLDGDTRRVLGAGGVHGFGVEAGGLAPRWAAQAPAELAGGGL